MLCLPTKSKLVRVILLNNDKTILGRYLFRKYASKGPNEDTIAIGNVVKKLNESKRPEYVPRKYHFENIPQSNLHHLKWMLEKDLLQQDVFLLGPPGSRKRRLAMQYLELIGGEHEYVAISRDTTESDLKQRREIVAGTAKYFDQSAVRAAVEGRVLVLEGIEKAERNVLPVLNNLLENREMHLEDGRMLISPSRYDRLLEEHGEDQLDQWKLVKVDENFRVVALGLPVPKYRGNPLDPPLRSRFQVRDVYTYNYQEWYDLLRRIAPGAPVEKLEKILSCAFALVNEEFTSLGHPDFPLDNLPSAALILEKNPSLTPYEVIYQLYPYKTFLKEGLNDLEDMLIKLQVEPPQQDHSQTNFSDDISNAKSSSKSFVDLPYHRELIEKITSSIEIGDVCIVGRRGCGKNTIANMIADKSNKPIETIPLYQDMTSRDLIQQRVTLSNGDTVWRNSPLIEAALEGKITVLDGIDRIHPSTLTILYRLVQDREIQLHDGTRLINRERCEFLRNQYGLGKTELAERKVFEIHPDFRIIAIGEPSNARSDTPSWLSSEMLNLFVFHEMRSLTKSEEMHIVRSLVGTISKPLQQVIDLAHVLRSSPDATLRSLSGHLSTRKILQIAAKMRKYPNENVHEIVESAFMIKFLPTLAREALEKTIANIGILPMEESHSIVRCEIIDGRLTIGETICDVRRTENSSKVPDTLFYDVPQHVALMEEMLQDFELGYHLLLVGNQGVGKNKIVDRFLHLLNRPREYIQLHRDTTVQTLTVQPTIVDGVLLHEDSALVKAVKNGDVLVIDEADKAPTHVTCVLKTLVESGEMILSDGRRIVDGRVARIGDSEKVIVAHPDFRLIVLANRPGFPFLGNDFFGSLGDLFASHSVDNPSRSSEMDLLKRYGPDVDEDAIGRLLDIFGDLRTLSDRGIVNYPYSTRELVNIVKHLQKFPESDLEDVIFNVFDFDRYNPEMVETIGEILLKHGFSDKNITSSEYVAKKRSKEYLKMAINRKSGLDVKGPKHGKDDPNNEPHVGGNTWAGGTGGRDTAGLGGKGGPYRLDKGHQVHQLSDEEKNSVPEHVRKAAREMNRKHFREKLKEIGMSGYDASVYAQFSDAVRNQVRSLRVILGNLQSKNEERQWHRHQTSGELDDGKLIDGLLGEKSIYRRRTEKQSELGAPPAKPKLFRVVSDVSGSMYRFNSFDGRLDRQLEAVVLVMEAFENLQQKIRYDIIGHSGEEYNLSFVKKDDPPKNNMERLNVIRLMHAHSQFCWSGDNTLESTKWAIDSIKTEDYDEAIVIVLSDANLQRYGIPPSELAKAMSSRPDVRSYAIFIGSLGDQAERLTKQLPAGRAFICNNTAELPKILQQIFSSSLI
ncbi:unnamed protein product [Phyllotreta striolata]|uniref:von Willebrand factor A domain-containing protein 8 n=1 Tax=Phyllotreta striolata TaxID=444603 RepID=A0A9N9XPD5_PHYSR|nr:unnamed protein product [Phyllotreta striolata]